MMTAEEMHEEFLKIKKEHAEMHEALKREVEMLKVDMKFETSEMIRAGYIIRIGLIESLINEIEK